MIQDILSSTFFEIKSALKKISTYVYFLIFFSFSAFSAYVMGGGIKGGSVSFGFSERMFINSPITILNLATLFTALGSSIIAAVFGQSICKDYLANFNQVLYSKPFHMRSFLFGRFLGTLFVMTFVFASIPLGIALATLLPGLQDNMVTNTTLWQYLQPLVVSVIPNIFIFGSIYFVVASMTKKMGTVYIAGILVLMGWLLSQSLMGDMDNKTLASIIDPFGLSGINESIKYWSVSEKQQGVLWWTSYFLYNRIVWVTFGFACLGHAVFRFNPIVKVSNKKKLKKLETDHANQNDFIYTNSNVEKSVSPFSTLIAQIRLELKQVTQNINFITLILAAVLHLAISSTQIGKMFGTNTYPVTHKVLVMISAMLNLYIMVIITYWCGELVWRDRDNRFNQIVDSTPSSTFSIVLSKILTVNVITTFFMFIFMMVGLAVQTLSGYFNYEIGHYVFDLFALNSLSFFFLSCLALFFQTAANNKYIANGLMILFFVAKMGASFSGISDKLFLPNSAPLAKYSDMNGYGHFLFGYFTFKIHWMILGLILLSLSYLLWPRGTGARKTIQWRTIPLVWKRLLVSLVILFLSSGSFIYYNTHVLNEFVSQKISEKRNADYEILFQKFRDYPQLTTTEVFPKVDIFPHSQELKAEVTFTLENKTENNINQIFINLPVQRNTNYKIVSSSPFKLIEENRELGVKIYNFYDPIKPGEKVILHYSVEVLHRGFQNEPLDTVLVENGTFIHNFDYFPSIGYDPHKEIESNKTRAKYGLAEKLRMPTISDSKNKLINYITPTSHWIDFETIVSTSEDQIAIAPGYLVKEWKDQNRRYFHYKMDQKILNFYAFLSGKYEVKKALWHSPEKDVNIEIYYHPGHTSNLDSMIESAQMGLSYFSQKFSPYQYRQYRIIEFPLYENYAQAFPNTIPFSENLGFIAKVDPKDPEDINYPFYITAHELAHQWWAHQVIGANVQGTTMLSESLAQYSALMVMEKKFGRPAMKKFLKYELNGYLSGRGAENQKELPLRLNENQGYIHYEKASLAFYAAKDLLTENVLNHHLKEFIEKFAFKGPPYPTANDLIETIYHDLPQVQMKYLDGLFSAIELFDNRTQNPTITKMENGLYEVTFEVEVKKWTSDYNGFEKELFLENYPLTVGIRNKNGDFIYFEEHYFQSGANLVKLNLKEEPFMVGIDPINILIDKNPNDNETKIKHLF